MLENLNIENKIGRLIFYLSIVSMFTLVFFNNFSLSDYKYKSILIGFLILTIFSISILFFYKNYKFDNFIISILYRTSLIFINYEIIKLLMIKVQEVNELSAYFISIIFGSIFCICIVNPILSFPFKIFASLLNDNQTDIFELYSKKNTYTNNNKSNKLLLKYSTLNETELQIHLSNAIRDENYEEAELIKKELTRFK